MDTVNGERKDHRIRRTGRSPLAVDIWPSSRPDWRSLCQRDGFTMGPWGGAGLESIVRSIVPVFTSQSAPLSS